MAAVLAVGAGAALAVLALTKPGSSAPVSVSADGARAAAWVAGQVSPATVVSCDPAMCGQLRRDGFPAARLLALGPASRDPLGSGVVIATAAVRADFGAELGSDYAPLVIAGFGAGPDRIEVRAVAPDGPAALAAQLSAQRTSLAAAGRQLLRNPTVQASAAARSDLMAGHVDGRLLANLSVLSSQQPISLVAFDAAAPGASPAVPLRGVQLAAAPASYRSAILAFLRAQRGTYRAAVAASGTDGHGQPVVIVRFDIPEPLSAP